MLVRGLDVSTGDWGGGAAALYSRFQVSSNLPCVQEVGKWGGWGREGRVGKRREGGEEKGGWGREGRVGREEGGDERGCMNKTVCCM